MPLSPEDARTLRKPRGVSADGPDENMDAAPWWFCCCRGDWRCVVSRQQAFDALARDAEHVGAIAPTKCGRCGKDEGTPVPPGIAIASLAWRYDNVLCDWCEQLTWVDLEHSSAPVEQAVGCPCRHCKGTGRGRSEYHYVRGHGISNECNHCDGTGEARA